MREARTSTSERQHGYPHIDCGDATEKFYRERATLIDGASGFVGAHCLRALNDAGAHVSALAGSAAPDVDSPHATYTGDLRDAASIRSVLERTRPSILFHLAARTPASPFAPTAAEMLMTNALGTLNLLEGVRAVVPRSRVLVFSSSAVYGEGGRVPVDEDAPLAPTGDYGASKAAQEIIAAAFVHQHNVDVVRVRTFNLIGAGEPRGLVCSSIASQIALAETGVVPNVISVGDTAARRDFTDVRDAVRAYLLVGAHARAGEVYNVCGARTVTIGEVLERLIAHARINVRVERRADAERVGSTVRALCGSYERLHRLTGWQPRITLDDSLRDLLDWWREKVRTELLGVECDRNENMRREEKR